MTCAHIWLVAPPDGPASPAQCTLCGQVRTFFNSLDADPDQTYDWNNPTHKHAAFVRRMVKGGRGMKAEV